MIQPSRSEPGLSWILRYGARVMVRRRLSPAEIESARGTLDEGKTLTDIVGEVLDDGDPVVIKTRRHGRTTIARRDIVTAKARATRNAPPRHQHA